MPHKFERNIFPCEFGPFYEAHIKHA